MQLGRGRFTAGGNIAGAGADILIFLCLCRLMTDPSRPFIKHRGREGSNINS